MSKEAILMALGVLIALLPFLGFPGSWKSVGAIILGVLVAGISFVIRQERIWKEREHTPERRTDSFVDNTGMHMPPRV